VTSTIDIAPHDLETIRQILQKNVPELTVWAFGSRVSGTARKFSDLDIVLVSDKSLDSLRMAIMRDEFSESDLPFKVDIIEWYGVEEYFREIIKENYFILQNV
jgi:predicted nucleotidyltransferase